MLVAPTNSTHNAPRTKHPTKAWALGPWPVAPLSPCLGRAAAAVTDGACTTPLFSPLQAAAGKASAPGGGRQASKQASGPAAKRPSAQAAARQAAASRGGSAGSGRRAGGGKRSAAAGGAAGKGGGASGAAAATATAAATAELSAVQGEQQAPGGRMGAPMDAAAGAAASKPAGARSAGAKSTGAARPAQPNSQAGGAAGSQQAAAAAEQGAADAAGGAPAAAAAAGAFRVPLAARNSAGNGGARPRLGITGGEGSGAHIAMHWSAMQHNLGSMTHAPPCSRALGVHHFLSQLPGRRGNFWRLPLPAGACRPKPEAPLCPEEPCEGEAEAAGGGGGSPATAAVAAPARPGFKRPGEIVLGGAPPLRLMHVACCAAMHCPARPPPVRSRSARATPPRPAGPPLMRGTGGRAMSLTSVGGLMGGRTFRGPGLRRPGGPRRTDQ